MKPIKLFYQTRCPFCKRAFSYIDELKKRPEYKDIVIETIEETEHPDIADQYDYYTKKYTKAASTPTKSKPSSKKRWKHKRYLPSSLITAVSRSTLLSIDAGLPDAALFYQNNAWGPVHEIREIATEPLPRIFLDTASERGMTW